MGVTYGLYVHVKTGGIYRFLHIAHDESTGQELVNYQCNKTGKIWSRPYSEFTDGRFEYVGYGVNY